MRVLNTMCAILGIGLIFVAIVTLIWWVVDIINEKRRQNARERLSRKFDRVKENSLDASKEEDSTSCH